MNQVDTLFLVHRSPILTETGILERRDAADELWLKLRYKATRMPTLDYVRVGTGKISEAGWILPIRWVPMPGLA